MKFHWRVDPKPTGPYASFQRRAWPECWNLNPNNRDAQLIADIVNLDGNGYEGADAKRTDLRLKVKLFLYQEGQERQARISRQEFKSIAECKDWVAQWFKKHQMYLPKVES